jgi:hypothetical protein
VVKSLFLLTAGGALAAACIAFASGAAAEHLLKSWKLGQGGAFTATFALLLAAINQILLLPAKVLAVRSQSSVAFIVAGATCFVRWGIALAVAGRRIFRSRRANAYYQL